MTIFAINHEYSLHSLRNAKVNFVYLVRLLLYSRKIEVG